MEIIIRHLSRGSVHTIYIIARSVCCHERVTVHLAGTRWSVLRNIGTNRDSRAAVDVEIEDLQTLHAEACDYATYARSLATSFVHRLPGFMPERLSTWCTWPQLLAWLARDQEARYQRLWEWRNHHSQSKTSPLGKVDAGKLIRTVLGLFSADEETLARNIDQWKAEHKRLGEDIVSQGQTVTSHSSLHKDILRSLLLADGQTLEDSEGLFLVGSSLPSLATYLLCNTPLFCTPLIPRVRA